MGRVTTVPALLAISHGTASPAGQAAVAGLVEAVARRLPAVTVRLGHVDVQQPDVAASLDAIPEGTPVVIVPLLLSAGYHVRVDLRQQSAGRDGVVIAPALGPDPRLVDVLLARLMPLAPAPDDEIVLAVAGSSDDRANEDCREIGRMLGARLGRDVSVGFLAAADPRLDVAVAKAVASPATRTVVANYLLAPGYFHDLAVRMAAGAPVAPPLVGDDEPPVPLVEIVVDRYRDAAGLSD
ncbi:CbiX/SirB N-terminal domain-containing protein [Microbacterium sp. B35-30]|uniref:sirohydrochlorin chelatase n=1 Tax=Microbacterium sp. B35-30 TaxID=1962642 RepID=UPI0013D1F071|nr:CbiX/SirB N-terminal domain-containing protein [Microbacterium sp. B35-30]KAF2420822.1 cobalamin biosynthesis protein CbiX [Microbacterium sp. B35-30]